MFARVLSAELVAMPTLDPVPAAVLIALIFNVRITVWAIVETCDDTTLLRPMKLPVKVLRLVLFTVASPKAVDAVVEIPGIVAVSSVSPVMLLTDVETTLLKPVKLPVRVLRDVLVWVATLEPTPAAVEMLLILSVKITVCAIVETCVETTLLKLMKLSVRVLRDVLVVITTGRKLLTAEERSSIAASAPL